METNYKKIFYVGIAYGAYPEKGRKLKKTGLEIRKLETEFPCLMGKGRALTEKVQIYYALLPEYSGKALLTGKPKGWKPEAAGRLLAEAEERAFMAFDCREQILAPELNNNSVQAPAELMAACLYRQRPFDRICISLPEEGGEYCLEQAIDLLCPYLPRMRQVVWKGKESYASGLLEDYLYEEFGIVMIRTDKPRKDIPWLDLCGEPDESKSLISHKNLRHISRRETLKFLDTAVKNGYNTKVNSRGR